MTVNRITLDMIDIAPSLVRLAQALILDFLEGTVAQDKQPLIKSTVVTMQTIREQEITDGKAEVNS